MRTRREQMQAYRFVIRRIVAAILSGEPETLDRPMRRLGISLFVSAMLAVLVFAGFGVYGLLTNPGSDSDEAGELIAVRGGGPIFVSMNDVLHPVPNLASGRLILGDVEVRQVSRDSLLDRPRGIPLGIPGAPSDLPDSDDLVGLPWWVCSVPDPAGVSDPTTTVVIDRSLSSASTGIGERALHVVSEDNEYLLWNNARLLIQNKDQARGAMSLTGLPIEVGKQLINSTSAGPDLAPPEVPGTGADSSRLPGAQVGDLFVVEGDHYLLTTEGLGRVNEVSVQLLDAQGVQAKPLDLAPAIEVGILEEGLEEEGFPAYVPEPYPATRGATICTAYEGEGDGRVGTTIEVLDSAPEELSTGAGSIPLQQTALDSAPVADRAVIAGGRGALVKAIAQAGQEPAEGDTVYLITDQGIKYPILGNGVEALGYGDVDPISVPADLLALLPVGATLSQDAAQRQLPSTPSPPPG